MISSPLSIGSIIRQNTKSRMATALVILVCRGSFPELESISAEGGLDLLVKVDGEPSWADEVALIVELACGMHGAAREGHELPVTYGNAGAAAESENLTDGDKVFEDKTVLDSENSLKRISYFWIAAGELGCPGWESLVSRRIDGVELAAKEIFSVDESVQCVSYGVCETAVPANSVDGLIIMSETDSGEVNDAGEALLFEVGGVSDSRMFHDNWGL